MNILEPTSNYKRLSGSSRVTAWNDTPTALACLLFLTVLHTTSLGVEVVVAVLCPSDETVACCDGMGKSTSESTIHHSPEASLLWILFYSPKTSGTMNFGANFIILLYPLKMYPCNAPFIGCCSFGERAAAGRKEIDRSYVSCPSGDETARYIAHSQ